MNRQEEKNLLFAQRYSPHRLRREGQGFACHLEAPVDRTCAVITDVRLGGRMRTFICTRELGHTGHHSACGHNRESHPIHTWRA